VTQRPRTRVEALLVELCSKHGYCLPPDARTALTVDPPCEVDAFVDAVLAAEGLSPDTCDRATRRTLRAVVRGWLVDDGTTKGSRSGLPSGLRAN
jgi:hypothetical protein